MGDASEQTVTISALRRRLMHLQASRPPATVDEDEAEPTATPKAAAAAAPAAALEPAPAAPQQPIDSAGAKALLAQLKSTDVSTGNWAGLLRDQLGKQPERWNAFLQYVESAQKSRGIVLRLYSMATNTLDLSSLNRKNHAYVRLWLRYGTLGAPQMRPCS